MTVVSSTTDPERLTLTLVVEFDANPESVWQLWEDPRKLERWWGPPGFPTVFTRHELVPGGESRWIMTVPGEPDRRGWWRVDAVDRPSGLEFVNGPADVHGDPLPDVRPYTCSVRIVPIVDGTRLTAVFRFATIEQMKSLAEGMRVGLTAGLGQMDALIEPHS